MAFDVGLCNSGTSFNVNIGVLYKKYLSPIKNLLYLNQANCCEDGTTNKLAAYLSGVTISAEPTGSTASYQGSYSCKVVTPGNTDDEGVTTSQSPNYMARILPNTPYTFSVWLKGSGTVTLWIVSYKEGITAEILQRGSPITLTGTWTRYSLILNNPENRVWGQVYVDTEYAASPQAITFYVDAMQLERGLAATDWEEPLSTTSVSLTKPKIVPVHLSPIKNLFSINVANACEDGTTTGFALYKGSTITADSTEHYQGSYSLKVVTPNVVSDEGVVVYPFVNVKPSTVYTCSVWLKGSGTLWLFILEYDQSETWLREHSDYDAITLTSTWTRYSITRVVGADCAKLGFYVDTDVKQAATYYLDSLQLEVGGSDSTWELPTTTTVAPLIATFIAGGINQNISASVGFTVSLIKSFVLGRTLAANATFTPSITKVSTRLRTISANAAFSVSILKALTLGRILSANSAFTVTLTRIITAYRSISASLASTVSIGALKSKFVTLSASLASTVSLVKGLTLNRTLSVTEAPSPSLSRFATLYRTLSASATFTSVLNVIKQAGVFYQTVSANATFAVSVLRGTYRTLSAPATFTVSISKLSTLYRSLSVNATFTVAISRITTALRTLAANATFTVGLVRGLTIYRVLSVVENAVVTLSRTLSMQRTLSVTEQPVPTLSRLAQLKRTLSAVVSFITSVLSLKNPLPEESVCVHVTCELNNAAIIECGLNPSITIECPTDDKEVTVECYLRCG